MNVSLQNIDKVSAELTVKPVSYTHLDVYKRQIEHYGNTSAATLPLCIWDFEDKLKKGDNIIFTARCV